MLKSITRTVAAGLIGLGCAAIPAPALAFAPSAPVAEATQEGFDAARLKAIPEFIKGEVAAGKIPGMVLLVLRDGKPVLYEAVGEQSPGVPMKTDSVHRIASTTKIFVATAAMRLYEQGKFKLSDPVSTYLPELKDVKVLATDKGQATDPASQLVAPRRAPTIHDLLRHTAGLTYYWIGPTNPVRQNQKDQDLEGLYSHSADEMLAKLGQQPLLYQPGSTFEYSIATDVLGHVLERIEKKPLDRVLSEQVLQPLGLKDTVWHVDEALAQRLAEPSRQTLEKDPLAWVFTWLDLKKPPKRFSGGAGLASTTGDVARLLQMLANGGEIDGMRLLSPKTVRYMLHVDHLNGVRGPHYNAGEGYGWSLVNPVRITPGVHETPGNLGDLFWGGITGPRYVVDPAERLVIVALFQAPSLRAHYYTVIRQMVYGAMMR